MRVTLKLVDGIKQITFSNMDVPHSISRRLNRIRLMTSAVKERILLPDTLKLGHWLYLVLQSLPRILAVQILNLPAFIIT